MNKTIKIFLTSALLPFVFACNEAPSKSEPEPVKKTDNQKKWADAKDSTNKALQQSKKAGEDIWDASKGSSKELWHEGKESSKEFWQDSKNAGSEIWDDVKNKSSDVWEKGSTTLDELLDTQQPPSEAQPTEDEI